MARIVGLGCGLSIDDFGTGYSSLTRLQKLPATEIKIDKSFVMHLTDNPSNEIIVESTLNLARTLELGCVAEGVEDERAAEILQHHGCREAQGFHFSKPVPQDEAFELLQGQLVSGN